jgi:NitT/TauT family transport system ATP-binding protein
MSLKFEPKGPTLTEEPKIAPSTLPKLIIDGVSKRFKTEKGETHSLDNISFSINDAEFVCLVGPSGCGKSTLLNFIAGLDFPDDGKILADGEPVTKPSSERMMMFQENALFPWLNVMGNVMFGLRLKTGLTDSERIEVAESYLKLVKLEKFKHSNIHELSGGMKQRVALARCLAPNPKLILMDEPFASLDAITREQLYADLQEICVKRKKTVLFVTHNVREAACLGDRIIILSPRPGRVHEQFSINLPRPRDYNSLEMAEHVSRINKALKHYIPTED